ncbi:MAG TPA: Holliday junction branch migration protein RuvA [Syntrophomonadaceae bacterium]|nr:Holliday junction branch migration protein RuvA [Syntrophomonadaceae bacterium]
MIAFVRGSIFAVLADSLTIDVNGIGYQVYVHSRDLARCPQAGEPVFLHTCLQGSDNEWKLYGFFLREEQELFLRLLDISGMGARSALNILGFMDPDSFYRAIASQDERQLIRIPGIGKKSAQRLIFELKDKVSEALLKQDRSTPGQDQSSLEVLFEALEALGYTRSEVLPLVLDLQERGEMGSGVEDNIKKVLKIRASAWKK